METITLCFQITEIELTMFHNLFHDYMYVLHILHIFIKYLFI